MFSSPQGAPLFTGFTPGPYTAALPEASGCLQVGTLEYDPEAHSKASHREWLSEKAVFKEVVPIADQTIRYSLSRPVASIWPHWSL